MAVEVAVQSAAELQSSTSMRWGPLRAQGDEERELLRRAHVECDPPRPYLKRYALVKGRIR